MKLFYALIISLSFSLILCQAPAQTDSVQATKQDSLNAASSLNIETELVIQSLDENVGSGEMDWQKLSLRQKIAQMIMVRIRGDFYNSDTWQWKDFKWYFQNVGIGGVITFGGSVNGTFQNIKTFQEWSSIPLLVAADYERGTGQWMDDATLFPPNMAVAATDNPENAFQQGVITAKEATTLGVHISFSPVMDVNNNPRNPIINFRSYGDDPELVTQYGNQFIKGLQSEGMIACAKHFPGHGNTATDSHSRLPVISGDRKSLDKMELYPFHQAVKDGIKMIMIGHMALPGIDGYLPATHSYKITSGILRDEWGFDGLIVTDGMEMAGLTKSAWAGESAVRSVEAGVDILLLPMDVGQTIDAIEQAVLSGRISEARIDESVARIWGAKTELGLFSESGSSNWEDAQKMIGKSDHKNTAKRIARESITVVKDNGQLPLKPEKIFKLGHLVLSTDDKVQDKLSVFLNDISSTHGNVTNILVTEVLSDNRISEIVNTLENMDQVIVTLLVRIHMGKDNSTIDSSHDLLLKKLNDANIPFITISFGSPYLPRYDILNTYICAYGYGSVSLSAAADAVLGRIDVNGQLPVTLSEKYPAGHGISIPKRTRVFDLSVTDIDLSAAWAVLDSAIDERIFPGAQIFIAQDGKLIANRSFGHLTYDSDSPEVTDQTRYDVASLTKVLVTTPITMKLSSKYLIGLDHTVDQYFPEFTGGGKESVTLRHLMTHSSGLPPFKTYYQMDGFSNSDDVIVDILSTSLDFTPGSQYQYSDLGMILMGKILEKVGKRSLDSMARSWVFKPFNMDHTGYLPAASLKPKIAPTEYDSVYRHTLIQGVVHDENTYLMGGVAPHAGVFSTAMDIANYAQMMVNGGTFLGRRYFESWMINQYTRRQDLPAGSDRAIGWDTPSRNGHSSAGDMFSDSSYGHLGFTGTSLWVDPDRKIVVVMLTNRVHPTRDRGGIYEVRRRFHTEVMKALITD
ncbi:MAG: serine hydrolase [Candidatus Marinimicrobia bacterium]|nr:serine hydrolase [Candidatus Neomarinimicrobiota bacterium]